MKYIKITIVKPYQTNFGISDNHLKVKLKRD